jgi:hypothetical protein
MSAYTDYPPIRRLPHLAPAMGAVPIFGPRYGQGWRFNGLGDTAPVTTSAPPSPDATTPTTITEPIAPATELAMGASTAMLSGAAVGGVAAGTWRGAGIGAGMNVGLWSALVAIGLGRAPRRLARDAPRRRGPRARARRRPRCDSFVRKG